MKHNDHLVVGYARCSTDGQDLEAQLDGLKALGCAEDRLYTDQGRSGRNQDRPGLHRALAAVRTGDTFVVTKLARLGRSVPDLREIADKLVARGVALQIGSNRYDPNDPVAKMLFNALAMVAEFERNMISQRTKDGLAMAKKRGRFRGKQRKLSRSIAAKMVALYETGQHTKSEIAAMYGVSRPTLYRELVRSNPELG